MSIRYKNIARVVRPHGKNGEVLVQPVRGLPFLLDVSLRVALTPPALDRDRFCTVESVRDDGRNWYVRFSGIDSIDAADHVRDCYVLAPEDVLDLGTLDVAWDDLIDRTVVDDRYGTLGQIQAVLETPANDVWQIEGAYGEVLIPVIDEVVSSIPDEGDIRVHIMDGLIADTPASPAHDRAASPDRSSQA